MSSAPSIAPPLVPVRRINFDAWLQRLMLIVILLAMGIFILAPLGVMAVHSVTDDQGSFVGLGNFASYFSDRRLLTSLWNTFLLGLFSMLIAVALAFPYAYAVTCARTPLRKIFLLLSMLPLYAPTMLYALGLETLFDRNGVLTTGFYDRIPFHFSADTYVHNLPGMIFAEVMATFPPAVLVLVVALSHRDKRLYDAAESMGASPFRVFYSITLPGCKFALISAASIAFVLSTTDLGAPEMLNSRTNVLALDLYSTMLGIGQKNAQAIGAVISLVLLIPTVIASFLEMTMRRRQAAGLTARSVPMVADRNLLRDWLLFGYCGIVSGILLLVTTAPVLLSLVTQWPYSLHLKTKAYTPPSPAFTLHNYNFDLIGAGTGGGMDAYWDSLIVAVLTAFFGTIFCFVTAYLVEKTSVFAQVRKLIRSVAIIPLGLPGMVLGISFVMIFNPLHWGPFPNPLAGIYGTITIIIICNVVHYLGVSYLAATTALTQLDGEFEQVAASMNVPAWRLFFRVTLPICLPAIIEISMYYFVSAMTTVSAIIFLWTATTPIASVAIVNLRDANLKPAAAMAVLILLSNIAVRAAVEPLQRYCRNRTQRWRAA
jgi:iron(III) transport system permease protein